MYCSECLHSALHGSICHTIEITHEGPYHREVESQQYLSEPPTVNVLVHVIGWPNLSSIK